MQLLTGPAGSGKTYGILQRFREALRRRDSGVRLLTPTATMAQHLQHQLAREGFVFRPGLIQTLSRFVDTFALDVPQVSEPLLYLIVEEAAARVKQPQFARVAGMPGFCAALARTIEEFSSAGCDSQRLEENLGLRGGGAPLGEAFLAVYREVDEELRRRGLATRFQRLALAAERIAAQGLDGVHAIWLDGFFALPDPELTVIEAMCKHAAVTLTLADAAITQPTRVRLAAMGFAEEVCSYEPSKPRTELCAAPSIEREADEIARRILQQAAAGRPFRDMGIIVRSQEIYEGILRTTLDRFGIPARFYFDSDLVSHALIRYLTGLVDSMVGGWDYAETLAAIRLAPALRCDKFDFAVRERMPGRGLAGLRDIVSDAEPEVRGWLHAVEALEAWRALSQTPAEWVARLEGLRGLALPARPEPDRQDTASIARGQAAVLQLFDEAMAETVRALKDTPVQFEDILARGEIGIAIDSTSRGR